MKVNLGGQKFQNDDELKYDVLNKLHSQAKAIHAAAMNNFAE
jgi:hypothetical protein